MKTKFENLIFIFRLILFSLPEFESNKKYGLLEFYFEYYKVYRYTEKDENEKAKKFIFKVFVCIL
jgi:hypothetical protein